MLVKGAQVTTAHIRIGCQWMKSACTWSSHDDVIKWRHFPRSLCAEGNWPSVNSPHKGQWRGALMFFFYLRLNKRLSKQSICRWLDTPPRSLWGHCNGVSAELLWIVECVVVPVNGRRATCLIHTQFYVIIYTYLWHRNVELILNWIGLKLVKVSVAKLPHRNMSLWQSYLGILKWHLII